MILPGRVRGWLAPISLLLSACTPSDAPAVAPARTAAEPQRTTAEPERPEPTPTPPAPAVEPADPPASPEPEPPRSPPTLADLIADVGVAMAERSGRTTLFCESAQTWLAAPWATATGADFECPLVAGETVHVIGPDGVADWTTALEKHSVVLQRTGARAPKRRTVLLAMKTFAPSPKARLERRLLSRPSADASKLDRWVERELGRKVVPIGEVRGAFGGGVDRVVVFGPRGGVNLGSDDAVYGEVAVLVAAGTPRGIMPFVEDPKTNDELFFDAQVGGVFDLDGDGIEEILWWSLTWGGDAIINVLHISWFADGEHRVEDIWSHSYGGFEEFMRR